MTTKGEPDLPEATLFKEEPLPPYTETYTPLGAEEATRIKPGMVRVEMQVVLETGDSVPTQGFADVCEDAPAAKK